MGFTYNLLKTAIISAVHAGKEILKIYNSTFDIEFKDDSSPLTTADKKSNEVLLSYLKKTGIPVLSEEGKSIPFQERKLWKKFWLVDPLDGTREFIKKNGEFTVNIAFIQDNRSIAGVIYIPVKDVLYFGSEQTGSIKFEGISKREIFPDLKTIIDEGIKLPNISRKSIYTVVGSKSHMNAETKAYIDQLKLKYGNINFLSRGSSLKICMVAEGGADEYPRFAPTMEWDIAAGDAIATYAEASIINANTNTELTYNSETLVNPSFIVKRFKK
ncbi:MAG: 3'(2'),5'-bisphosphate nucleotidase CysQ [Bacteroidales bacterium]|nr:3'(2'),5'-bisphosphate nucleotidase CysQ [Bacteroidales bacterium]